MESQCTTFPNKDIHITNSLSRSSLIVTETYPYAITVKNILFQSRYLKFHNKQNNNNIFFTVTQISKCSRKVLATNINEESYLFLAFLLSLVVLSLAYQPYRVFRSLFLRTQFVGKFYPSNRHRFGLVKKIPPVCWGMELFLTHSESRDSNK